MARITVINARSSLGGSCPGAELGPDALLGFQPNGYQEPIVEALARKGHSVKMERPVWLDKTNLKGLVERAGRLLRWQNATPHYQYDERERGDTRNLEKVLGYAEGIRTRALKQLMRGRIPLTLGGDHSISLGVMNALALYHRTQETFWNKPRQLGFGVIWVDAHADYNNPTTSPSGNVHGMPLASVTGRGNLHIKHAYDGLSIDPDIREIWGNTYVQARLKEPLYAAIRPKNVVLVGVRDVDPGESENLKQMGVTVFTRRAVHRLGMGEVMDEAIKIATGNRNGKYGGRNAGFHLSFDLDSLDPAIAPGVSTAVPDGLTLEEGLTVMRSARLSGKMLSLDVVEYNPVRDHADRRTARCAHELILEAFGNSEESISAGCESKTRQAAIAARNGRGRRGWAVGS